MSFDPSSFMNQTVDSEMSTQVEQCPEGEFPAMIEPIDAEKDFASGEIQNGDRAGETWVRFTPRYVIQDGAIQAQLGREKVVVRDDGMWLDFDSSGQLDASKGKNVRLGQLRDALGQNKPGPWSFQSLSGAGPVMVKVTHVADNRDKAVKYARVTRVAKIS